MKATIFGLALLAALPATQAGQLGTLEVTEQRNAAVGFALTGSIATERMEKACALVPEAAAQFSEARRQWELRNRPYVDAANGWMTHVKSLLAQQKGSEVAEAFIANTYSVFSDEASMMAAESLPGSPPTAANCQKWAVILDSKKFDLDRNAEFTRDLKDIRNVYESKDAKRGR